MWTALDGGRVERWLAMRTRIELTVEGGRWVTTTIGGEGEGSEAQVRELFGTNVIPTPFPATMAGEEVRSRIHWRNIKMLRSSGRPLRESAN